MEGNAYTARLTLGLQRNKLILTPSGHKYPFSASICTRSSTGNHYQEPLQLRKRLVCQYHIENNNKIRQEK
jgi:hypothetical protein